MEGKTEGRKEGRKEITRWCCASHVTNKKRTVAKEVTATHCEIGTG